MYECMHISVCIRMCTKMYIVTLSIIGVNMIGQQSANFVKVFVIERSTVELKIRNLRKLICIWDVIEDVKESWVKRIEIMVYVDDYWITIDKSD